MASSTTIIRAWALVLLLQIIVPRNAQSLGPGMTVTAENELVKVGQVLDVHCTLNGKDLGKQSLMPFNRFEYKFNPSALGGDVFTCTFAAAGKPTTTIDLYKGFRLRSRSCECVGIDHCFWQVLNEGFWCNSKFIKAWGK